MRLMTNSQLKSKGLISIKEADENVPQIIDFCIPIEVIDAKNINNIYDFQNYFSRGIFSQIKDSNNRSRSIYLQYSRERRTWFGNDFRPMFSADVVGNNINF